MLIKILAGIYVLLLAAIIFTADLRETQHLFGFIRSLPLGDKIGHFVLMGLLSFWLNLALRARTIKVWRINFLFGTLVVLLAVTIEEISQIFIRGRTFDLVDLLFDAAGIFAFGPLARLIVNRQTRRNLTV